MAVQYNYSSTAGEYVLQMALTPTATVVQLDSVTGLPSAPFKIVVEPGQPTEEIVKVTTVAGTSLTVVRGWDGTSAVSHGAPCTVRHMMTAEDLRLSREHEDSLAAHGTTGNVVGTTDAQTLTNKNLTSGSNAFPSYLATLTGSQVLTNKDLSSSSNSFPPSLATLTGTQTLTNKTLSGSSNAFTNIPQSAVTGLTTIQSDVNALKTDVNTLKADTGIATSGFSAKTGWSIATAQYRIKNGVCQVYCRVQRTGAAIIPPSSTDITNVPVLSVPAAAVPSMPAGGSAVADGPLIAAFIWPDGGVALSATAGTIATNDYISLSFTYLV